MNNEQLKTEWELLDKRFKAMVTLLKMKDEYGTIVNEEDITEIKAIRNKSEELIQYLDEPSNLKYMILLLKTISKQIEQYENDI